MNSRNNKSKTNSSVKKWAKDLNKHLSKGEVQMTGRHMKKLSGSLAVRKVQIKTAMRF